MNDHVLVADLATLGQTAVAVEEHVPDDVHVILAIHASVVRWILVEAASASDHLTAARRALLQVASQMVKAAGRNVAVAATVTGPRHATFPPGLLAPRDELHPPALVVQHGHRARRSRVHFPIAPSTDRHYRSPASNGARTWPDKRNGS